MLSKSSNVKNEMQYEALKDKGMSKQRAAKIANSPGASQEGGKKSRSGAGKSQGSQGGTTAQKKKAGSKGGKAAAKKKWLAAQCRSRGRGPWPGPRNPDSLRDRLPSGQGDGRVGYRRAADDLRRS